MKALQILSLSVFLFVFGCTPEIIDPPLIDDPIVNDRPVDFEQPMPGQETMFLRYESSCGALDDDFHFTTDTLILSVEEENGALYFSERFTPNSPMYKDAIQIDPIKHKIIDEEGRLLLPERWSSPLFFFYGNDTLDLTPQNKVPLNQEGCKLILGEDPFIGNEIGQITSFEFGEIKQENKTVVSCVPIMIALDAYLVYTSNSLYMSHTIANDSQVQGWVRAD